MRSFYSSFVLAAFVAALTSHAELRTVEGANGVRYQIDSESYRVYASPELNGVVQMGPTPPITPSAPPPFVGPSLNSLGVPLPAASSSGTSAAPPPAAPNPTAALLNGAVMPSLPSGGYQPTMPLSAGQAATVGMAVREVFGGRRPTNDWSRQEAGMLAYHQAEADSALSNKHSADQAFRNGLPAKADDGNQSLPPRPLPSLLDLSSIPDPAEAELPYRFASQGAQREELVRLYKQLYKAQPALRQRKDAREMGLRSVEAADASYAQRDEADGNIYKQLAVGFLDIAVGIDPITGIARSAYELYSGRNLISGARLSTFERSVAFVGVVTLGTSGLARAGSRMFRVFEGASRLLAERQGIELAIRDGEALYERVAPLLSGTAKRFRLVAIRTAEEANKIFPAHYLPKPFQAMSHVVEFVTTKETEWLRVFSEGSRADGRWIMRKDAVRGLTPAEIAQKFQLPSVPSSIVDVHVPRGTTIWRGNVGALGESSEGAIQYYLDGTEKHWFVNSRNL